MERLPAPYAAWPGGGRYGTYPPPAPVADATGFASKFAPVVDGEFEYEYPTGALPQLLDITGGGDSDCAAGFTGAVTVFAVAVAPLGEEFWPMPE